ncbi:winged helix-turn-helix domain-containing protein [Vibrio profundum]|uniref:helix-turn-helix domain-containing protein n=1 Tax=Vibrio profundum TaxID=2910247 RepID=UPI003D12A28F
MTSQTASKTQTSFLRRLLVAYLIDSGKNTLPAIIEATGMPRRTAQDTIKAIQELEVTIEQHERGKYRIVAWGAINPNWIEDNIQYVYEVLRYPIEKMSVNGNTEGHSSL